MTTLLDPSPAVAAHTPPNGAGEAAPSARNGGAPRATATSTAAPATLLAQASRPAAGDPLFPVRRFTVAEYDRLVELGLFGDEERVELLDGWIAPQKPHSPLHDGTIGRLTHEAGALIPANWRARIQSAVSILENLVNSPPVRRRM